MTNLTKLIKLTRFCRFHEYELQLVQRNKHIRERKFSAWQRPLKSNAYRPLAPVLLLIVRAHLSGQSRVWHNASADIWRDILPAGYTADKNSSLISLDRAHASCNVTRSWPAKRQFRSSLLPLLLSDKLGTIAIHSYRDFTALTYSPFRYKVEWFLTWKNYLKN